MSALESGRESVSGVSAILYKTNKVSFPGKVKLEQRPDVDKEASQADINGKCLKQKEQKAQRS